MPFVHCWGLELTWFILIAFLHEAWLYIQQAHQFVLVCLVIISVAHCILLGQGFALMCFCSLSGFQCCFWCEVGV